MIEAVLLGALFLVPLMWMLGMLAQVHQASLASGAAAREAGARVATSTSRTEAIDAIEEAVASVMQTHGLEPRDADVRLRGDTTISRGGTVEVAISYPVPVLSAPLIGSVAGPSITVRARHVAVVEPYASR